MVEMELGKRVGVEGLMKEGEEGWGGEEGGNGDEGVVIEEERGRRER